MSDQPPEETLMDEFRTLGKNLADTMRAAWERPERKNLQNELESGLTEMGKTLRTEIEYFRQSPAAQRLRTDLDDLGQRVRAPEVEGKVRQELVSALQMVNKELEKVLGKLSEAGSSGEAEKEEATETPVEASAEGTTEAPSEAPPESTGEASPQEG